MNFVVDASVGVKWLLDETQSDLAERLLREATALIVPDLFAIEVASVLTKRLRRGAIDAEVLGAATFQLETIVASSVIVEPTIHLLRRMIAMSQALHHSLYDCAYLALAEERLAPVVTSDSVLARKLQGTEWASLACPLAEAPRLLA
jgi:predicted nucleic acid-binding protein